MSGKIKINEEKVREIAEQWGKEIYKIQTESRKKESEDIRRIYESLGIDPDLGPSVPDVESSEEEIVDEIIWNLCEHSDTYEVETTDTDDG